MGWLIRILFLIVIVTLVRFVLARLFAPTKRSAFRSDRRRTQMPTTVSGQMIRDPQCGTYVASELAVTGQAAGRTLHFCSSRCRDHYLRAVAEKRSAHSAG